MEDTSTYLGTSGYTIDKECLEPKELRRIREELTAKPYVPKSPVQPPSFPVYQESPKEIYLPRFYGRETFGTAEITRLSDGDQIEVPFAGDLRDYQKDIVAGYMDSTKGVHGGGGLLEIPCGRGKCHAPGTLIMMADGEVKPIENIRPGDAVMGDDSKPRNVISFGSGEEDMWRIKHADGTSYVVNTSHILALAVIDDDDRIRTVDLPLREYIDMTRSEPKSVVKYYGYRVPVEFPRVKTGEEPYRYGRASFDTPIPSRLRINSTSVRMDVLAGLIDTSGEAIPSVGYRVHVRYGPLSDSVVWTARTLGINVSVNEVGSDGRVWIVLRGHIAARIPVRVHPRVEVQYNPFSALQSIDVSYVGYGRYHGIEIDGNRRYLLADCVVTHNTVIALNIISQLKTKALVIVHKSFLMSQWIERIQQFLPSARVGKIQGQIVDIEDKDVVIGMLQSLSMKEYPSDMFSSFGLTVVDECHHISSEVFSRSLLKIVTRYCLGLSATMQRKDGLTKIFKMFLGDIVYSEKREGDDSVLVRGIRYTVNDPEYNETVYDYRGNPQYSTMLTKLCTYNRRTEFILSVIVRELEEEPDQQILVLGHYKNVLTYMHDAIAARNIAPVGYYIGGMKEQDLKESETKKIIIATYAMAAEALDIKTLTTLVLATPKTDIVQASGRILRTKHDRPLILDIIDSHEVFERQWQKRVAYYKKSKYTIATSTTAGYPKGQWEYIDTSSSKKKKKSGTHGDTGLPVGKCMITLS